MRRPLMLTRLALSAAIGIVMLAPLPLMPQVPPPLAGAVQTAQVDINNATEDELKQLPRIGEAYARRSSLADGTSGKMS
jgi:DNA uptake protein ComE-like DNA-binding protein